jgi:hypothetical protein
MTTMKNFVMSLKEIVEGMKSKATPSGTTEKE